jgi:hypothetical protein
MGMLNDLLLNPIVEVSEFTRNELPEVVFVAGVTALNQFV